MRISSGLAQHSSCLKWASHSPRYLTTYPLLPGFINLRPWRLRTIGHQRRAAKTKATIRLEDLQAGQQPFIELKDEVPAYPPVVQQAWNNMQKFPHSVILTKVGSFYEVCKQHPQITTGILNIETSFIFTRLINMARF